MFFFSMRKTPSLNKKEMIVHAYKYAQNYSEYAHIAACANDTLKPSK